MEIHPSARRHDTAEEDISHVYGHSMAWVQLDDDPLRYLLAGPDRAGNLLELVVLDIDGTELVIHAMPMRASTQQELFGEEER